VRYTDPTEPLTYNKNFSRVLHRAAAEGKTIVANAGPALVKGQPLVYEPRTKNDSRPWRPLDPAVSAFRFSGRECRVLESVGFELTRDEGDLTVTATREGVVVGHLTWRIHTREVRYVWVAPAYRRRGIATGMWNFAGTSPVVPIAPVHSSELPSDGKAWVASL
jgi:ribosomal protein S18 acetylase RimI-like enzyme